MEYFVFKTVFVCECQVVEMNNLVYNVCKIITLAVGEKLLNGYYVLFFLLFIYKYSVMLQSLCTLFTRDIQVLGQGLMITTSTRGVQKCVRNHSKGKNDENSKAFQLHLQNS
jgi:branched-subunit amino acid ABC-type transport system permease component